MADTWYLKTADGTFGPESRARLIEWARMGRIQPGQDVSPDGENWTPAIEMPFLEMRWSIDIGDGQPRGPFNKEAAQALLDSGRLPPESHLVKVAAVWEKDEPETESAASNDSAAEPAVETHSEEPTADEPTMNESTVTVNGPIPAETAADEGEEALEREREAAREAARRAEEAESKIVAAENEARAAREQLAAKESYLAAARAEVRDVRKSAVAAEVKAAEAESDLAELFSTAQANESEYEERIRQLSDEIKRLPSSAHLAADAQTALYALMKDEADELAAAFEAEKEEAEKARLYRQKRSERLLARRQELLRWIGTDAEEMTRRALHVYPEDPRTVRLRQELDALRVLQERSVRESEQRIRDLTEKLRDREAEAGRLRQQSGDLTVLYRQLQETRERLQRREKELVEERQKAEMFRQQQAASQQALLARLSALETGLPGGTRQSREARGVRLAPWMGLKK